jgi:hypothetical protein
MDFKTALYLLCAMWVFSEYTRNLQFSDILLFFKSFLSYLEGYGGLYYTESEDDDTSDDDDDDEDNQTAVSDLPVPKYEDKYLSNIRKLNKEWDFTPDELQSEMNAFQQFLEGSVDAIKIQIENNENEICFLKKEMVEDTDIINCSESQDDDGDEVIHETTLEERNEYRNARIADLQEECNKLKLEIEGAEGIENLRLNAKKQARDFVVNARLDKLKNNYVIEKTPLGNVLMIYDKDRGSFKYYADSTIPYRYLEPVGRKYVKLFNCRPLFVDMEEELKLVEEKWTKEYELKKAKEAEDRKRAEENQKPVEQKKNVFAKFKSYNKDAGGKISMAAPPKNSIPSKNVPETKENEKVLLKERANRYTYEGKFANFNFLQKIERKVFNKKLALSFSEFKKLQNK